jgi:hypothetical protein
MIQIVAYVARGNMPEVKNLSDLRELVKWLDESWLEAKRDAEAWDLKGVDARVAKLAITIDDQGDQRQP